MSFWDDPVGSISNTASDWGNKTAGVWHDVSQPLVDNPYGRMAVNYATGGMSAPFYAAYDYSQGKKLSPLQVAGAISGAGQVGNYFNGAGGTSSFSDATTGADAASTGTDYGNITSYASDASGNAPSWMDDLTGGTDGALGGNYMGGNDFQQNISQAGMGGYGGSDLSGVSDYEGPASQGLSYGSFGGLKDLWNQYGKFTMPALKMGAGLADMYAKRRMAADMRQQAGDVENRLNSYYSPNSPEAQLMRQRMERLDAASGRNSQYGVRETNLAAQLAKERMNAYSQALPSLSNMYGASSALNSGDYAGLLRSAGDLASNKDFMSSLGSLF